VEVDSVEVINMNEGEAELVVGDMFDEQQHYCEEYEESRDNLQMLVECEDPIPVWCDTAESSHTWHTPEVGPLPVCHDIWPLNFA
jgi:hypothetical protein